jgi:hypothetical protein
MTREEILDLSKRVEALSGPCNKTDELIVKMLYTLQFPIAEYGGPINYDPMIWQERHGFSPTASLDAAMQLVPVGFLHMVRTLWHDDKTAGNATVSRYKQEGNGIFWQDNYAATAATPALALTAAALRAIAESMEP